jgi:DNA-binding Lrp family transcriptional regulator
MAESDTLYFRVLGELYRHPSLREGGRESFAKLANSLGIDDNTVRTAMERMRKTGFLKTWSASLNPHVLGMECESIFAEPRKNVTSKIIRRLKLVEGVVPVMTFLENPSLRVIFYYKDEADLKRKTGLISSICEVDAPSVSWNIRFPKSKMKFKETDWQIVKILFEDSRKSTLEIAKSLRISTRTVRRRLEVMAEDSAFFPTPMVDMKKVDGFVYLFMIAYDTKENKSLTDDRLRNEIKRIIFLDTNSESHTVVATVCQNISKANKISEWLKSQNGVKQVIIRVVEDTIYVYDWILNEIERRQTILRTFG